MKKILLIFIFLLISQPCLSKTLQGGLVYTVETARIEAFKDVPLQIDMSQFQEHFFDKNYDKNMKAIGIGKTIFRDRYLTIFSDNEYSIEYKNDKLHYYYYDALGQLTHVEIEPYDKVFPLKSIMYDIKGNLDSTTLYISRKEQFVFDLNKKLIAHWIGKNCYDENGILKKTRNVFY